MFSRFFCICLSRPTLKRTNTCNHQIFAFKCDLLLLCLYALLLFFTANFQLLWTHHITEVRYVSLCSGHIEKCLLRKCMRYPLTLGLMMNYEINLIFIICKSEQFWNVWSENTRVALNLTWKIGWTIWSVDL